MNEKANIYIYDGRSIKLHLCAAESTTDEMVRALKRVKRKQWPQRQEAGPDNWALKRVEFWSVG
jgi:hypothetical protein